MGIANTQKGNLSQKTFFHDFFSEEIMRMGAMGKGDGELNTTVPNYGYYFLPFFVAKTFSVKICFLALAASVITS